MATEKQIHNLQVHNLQELLDRLKTTVGEDNRVSIGGMLDAVGRRSFGPILLLCGLIPASPLSGIPGLPTFTAVLVFIVIVQLLTGHQHFWLPQWLLNRQVSRKKFIKALDFLHRPAAWIDRLIYPRAEYLTTGVAVYVIAFVCAIIALIMPPLELIPFANTTTGIALAIFGLALISHDGLLVILGLVALFGSLLLGANTLI
ncbi:MAG: exopolysaccharide biosynthesis protein [Cellvibrionaceae bacterium]